MARWTPKDIVIISAGTGTGKSYFVKNSLYQYAKDTGKKILFLIHRSNCVSQFKCEIERDGKQNVIDIITYQKIEHDILNYNKHINYKQYAYIVCDEFHYFISDANFNNTTDISFKEILNQPKCIKIFMSATGEDVEKYLSNNYRRRIRKYYLEPNYEHVSGLTFFSQDEDIEHLSEMVIKANKKAIIFIRSAEKAYKLFRNFSKYSLFNCSKNNKHYKDINKEKINTMLKNERFEENLLITTSCLDAGTNIIDRDVKYIIADITDIGSLIQCLGRKRHIDSTDTVHFYIKTINNQRLSGLKQSMCKDIEMAEYLLQYGTQELILKYPRQVDKSRIIYDYTKPNQQKNMSTKKVNDMMLAKKRTDIRLYDNLMKTEYGYCKYLAKYLGFMDDKGNYTYSTFSKDHSLTAFLQKYVENDIVMLQVKDRKPIIEKLNVRSEKRRQLKKCPVLNETLKEMEIPFRIKEYKTSKIINGKKKNFSAAWKIIEV